MKTKSAAVVVCESNHPKCPWRVRYPGPNGERKAKFFADETNAREFATDQEKLLGQHGTDFGGVTGDEQAAIMQWRGLVTDAETEGIPAPGLLEVVREAADRWRQTRLGVTVADAFEEFMADREGEGASVRHLQSLRDRLGRFKNDFGGVGVGTITTDTIRGWLAGLKKSTGNRGKVSIVTRDNYRRSLLSLFNFVKGKGWITENPVPGLRKQKTKTAKIAMAAKRGILAPGEVADFMAALASVRTIKSGSVKDGNAKYHDHDHVSYWAIKAWAGLRDSEAITLEWEHVDLARGEITVPAEISKTGDERTVKIEPALDAWLRPRAKKRGRVAPQSEMTRRYALKKTLKILREPGEDGKPRKFDLPHNWARHSFASYHLYAFRHAGETAMQLGHQGNPAMLNEHYKNTDAERDAAAFWEIRPADPADNVTSINQRVA